jgi:ADP-heptose:LPS heptosyltransferase
MRRAEPQATRLAERPGPAGAWRLAKALYWMARRDPAAAWHVVRALAGFLASAIRLALLLRAGRDRRPAMAIALVEHLGDIVAAEPIARLARATYPGHRLVWVTRPAYRALPAAYPPVDAVLTVGCLTGWLLLWQLGTFDVVWDLHLNRRDCPRCRVPLVKSGAARLPEGATYARFGNLLDVQCAAAGLPRPADDRPVLTPPPAAVRAVGRLALPARFVAVHGRSNDARKDWRDDGWHALVERLLAAWDGAVVEVGQHPVAIAAATRRTRGGRAHSLCGRLSILETAEVIRRATLFVGIDSGPAHLANAVATPGVILLGAHAGFARSMPYSGCYADAGHATLLRADGPAATLTVEAVFAAAMARLRAHGPARDRPARDHWGADIA